MAHKAVSRELWHVSANFRKARISIPLTVRK